MSLVPSRPRAQVWGWLSGCCRLLVIAREKALSSAMNFTCFSPPQARSCGAGGARAGGARAGGAGGSSGSAPAVVGSKAVASWPMLGCAPCPVLQASRGPRVIAETSFAVERIPAAEEQTSQQCQQQNEMVF